MSQAGRKDQSLAMAVWGTKADKHVEQAERTVETYEQPWFLRRSQGHLPELLLSLHDLGVIMAEKMEDSYQRP